MIQRFAVPVGAGAVSALLFALTVKGTPLALALAYLAPMPLMIAAFGWGALGGLVAAVVAASALVAVFDLQGALAFLLVVAAPAWILPTFAVLPRYAPPWRRGDADVPARTPVGVVVTLAAALGALAGLAGLATLIIGYSGYEAGLQALISELTPAIEQALEGVDVLPDGVSARDVAEEVAKLAPLATATLGFLTLCANLYAAGRSTALSHRLPRPWPDLPTEFVLPRPLAVVAVIAVGVGDRPARADRPVRLGVRRPARRRLRAAGLRRAARAVARPAAASAADRRALFLLRRSRRLDAAADRPRRVGRQRGEFARARRGGAPLEDLRFAITPNVRRERWK